MRTIPDGASAAGKHRSRASIAAVRVPDSSLSVFSARQARRSSGDDRFKPVSTAVGGSSAAPAHFILPAAVWCVLPVPSIGGSLASVRVRGGYVGFRGGSQWCVCVGMVPGTRDYSESRVGGPLSRAETSRGCMYEII